MIVKLSLLSILLLVFTQNTINLHKATKLFITNLRRLTWFYKKINSQKRTRMCIFDNSIIIISQREKNKIKLAYFDLYMYAHVHLHSFKLKFIFQASVYFIMLCLISNCICAKNKSSCRSLQGKKSK